MQNKIVYNFFITSLNKMNQIFPYKQKYFLSFYGKWKFESFILTFCDSFRIAQWTTIRD